MTQADAAHIQASQVSYPTDISMTVLICVKAKTGNDMSSSGFAARAQSAGDRNVNSNASNNTRPAQSSSDSSNSSKK